MLAAVIFVAALWGDCTRPTFEQMSLYAQESQEQEARINELSMHLGRLQDENLGLKELNQVSPGSQFHLLPPGCPG